MFFRSFILISFPFVILILAYAFVERKERKSHICKCLGECGEQRLLVPVSSVSPEDGTCRKARSILTCLFVFVTRTDGHQKSQEVEESLKRAKCVRSASVGTDSRALYSNYCFLSTLQSSLLVTLHSRHMKLIDRPLHFSDEDK